LDSVNGPLGGDIFDVFNMFNGGEGKGDKSKHRKAKPVKKTLEINLENAYNGDFIKVPHSC